MVIARRISGHIYATAAAVTVLVFVLGFALGFVFDSQRVKILSNENKVQELDYKSLQLQYLMINLLDNNNNTCRILSATLEDSVRNLHNSLDRIQQYKQDSNFNADEYALLYRKYTLDNVQYWQLAKRAKESCNMNFVTVLYFFSTKYCSSCPDQGVILTYFKKRLGESLLIFPIDVDLEENERIVSLVRNSYSITRYPAIVVGDAVLEGRVFQKEELGRLICSSFSVSPEECAGVVGDEGS